MQPALFLSHGTPSLAIEDSAARRFLSGLADRLKSDGFDRPDAILIASPHWLTAVPMLSASAAPRTWHDFGGFDPRLNNLIYPTTGHPQLAHKIALMLRKAGFSASTDSKRPLDHGAWIPLLLAYPQADIPVVQMSVMPHEEPRTQLQLGHALRKLRRQNIMIIGSGSLTHNLHEARIDSDTINPLPHVADFDTWIRDRLLAGDTKALLDYRRRQPHAAACHPTDEHLLPLFFAMGAGGFGEANTVAKNFGSRDHSDNPRSHAVQLHSSYMYKALSMAAYRFG